MKLLSALLLVISAIVVSQARAKDAAPAPSPAEKDLAALQGEWSMVSGMADGFPIPDEMLPNSKRVCKGDEVTATVGGELVLRAKIKLDPTSKPKTIDYDVLEGPTKGQKHLGIYELDGDTFKSCFATPGEKRPTDFQSKSGDQRTSTVWKRKPAAKADSKAEKK
jgi:uncharacterized protein (TIGR03067 family)